MTRPANFQEGAQRPSPITRVLAFGYYDGPTEGVLQLGERGEVYKFDLTDEFPGQGPDETDLRQFALAPLPPDALDELTAALSPYFKPHWPVWVPVWSFSREEDRQEAERRIDGVLRQAGAVAWQVTTADLLDSLQTVKRVAERDGHLNGSLQQEDTHATRPDQ